MLALLHKNKTTFSGSGILEQIKIQLQVLKSNKKIISFGAQVIIKQQIKKNTEQENLQLNISKAKKF